MDSLLAIFYLFNNILSIMQNSKIKGVKVRVGTFQNGGRRKTFSFRPKFDLNTRIDSQVKNGWIACCDF